MSEDRLTAATDPKEGIMSVTPKDGPERITAEVMYEGKLGAVVLVRVAADEDVDRPWRIEAPGTSIDGWLVATSDLHL